MGHGKVNNNNNNNGLFSQMNYKVVLVVFSMIYEQYELTKRQCENGIPPEGVALSLVRVGSSLIMSLSKFVNKIVIV